MAERKDKIVNLFEEVSKKRKSTSRKPKPSQSQSIKGDNNIQLQVGGDLNINKREIKRVKLEPLPEHITPAQKQNIKEGINKLVEIDVVADGKPKELYPHWWSRLQKKFRVNSYHELTQDQYEDVIKWFSQQKAINRPKLRRRDNQAWRNGLYSAIWTIQREFGKPKEWVYLIVEERIGEKVNSLTKLGERNLKKLHNIMMGMKKKIKR